jgi:DNA-binding response OmpR family regulator
MTDTTHGKFEGKKVFLVEDDLFFTKLVDKKLSNSRCEFSHAGTGDEALKFLQNNTPDVVLLDIMLPGGLDGFAVLKKMKEDDKLKNIPVIILSNLSSSADVERGMSLGAFRYLVKASITPNDIVSHLASVFGVRI